MYRYAPGVGYTGNQASLRALHWQAVQCWDGPRLHRGLSRFYVQVRCLVWRAGLSRTCPTQALATGRFDRSRPTDLA